MELIYLIIILGIVYYMIKTIIGWRKVKKNFKALQLKRRKGTR